MKFASIALCTRSSCVYRFVCFPARLDNKKNRFFSFTQTMCTVYSESCVLRFRVSHAASLPRFATVIFTLRFPRRTQYQKTKFNSYEMKIVKLKLHHTETDSWKRKKNAKSWKILVEITKQTWNYCTCYSNYGLQSNWRWNQLTSTAQRLSSSSIPCPTAKCLRVKILRFVAATTLSKSPNTSNDFLALNDWSQNAHKRIYRQYAVVWCVVIWWCCCSVFAIESMGCFPMNRCDNSDDMYASRLG